MARKRFNPYPYKRHPSLRHYICLYCHLPGDTKDHVPPLSWVHVHDGERWIVRACASCNSRLGPRYIPTIESRKKYLSES